MILQPNHCPTARIAKAGRSTAGACEKCDLRFESRFPKGTRFYEYDGLIVRDGARIAHFPSPSRTWCDKRFYYVENPITNVTERFSLNARTAKILDYRETAVKPGEPIPWDLRRDLRLGIARFKFTKP